MKKTSEMISRNHQQLVQQYVDTEDSVRHIDNLKSRIYEAFFAKSYFQAFYFQSHCINSPVVIALAVNTYAKSSDLRLQSFELGYLTFVLSNNFYLDVSFCYYYREGIANNALHLFLRLTEKTKRLVLDWSIDPYWDYVSHRSSVPSISLANTGHFRGFTRNQLSDYKYVSCLNFDSYLRYIGLSAILSRLSVSKSIRRYLLLCFKNGIFSLSALRLGSASQYSVVTKANTNLSVKLVDIIVYYIHHEIYTMLSISYAPSKFIEAFVFVYYGSVGLILSKDSCILQTLVNKLKKILIFNGVKLVHSPLSYLPTLTSASGIDQTSMAFSVRFHPFRFTGRPPLYGQFALMKQISIMLINSISQPLFLLIIRLNKLLSLSLSSLIISHTAGKTFYLADYLIALRLKLFAKKYGFSLYSMTVTLEESFARYACGDSWQKNHLMTTVIFSYDSYRFYVSAKMFWIYRMKCLPN